MQINFVTVNELKYECAIIDLALIYVIKEEFQVQIGKTQIMPFLNFFIGLIKNSAHSK